MPRNPKASRIAQDTGMLEYDDSMPNIEGKCPSCQCIHSGAFIKCDGCIEEEIDRQYEDEREYEEYLEEMAEQESPYVRSIFSGVR